jgi:isopentenyl diphosphate isomerase/L-lactate dehydrogenase-like FMN-dependent dehydrogenase
MATGVDDDGTLRANREGFKKLQLRPRRLVDVSKVDLHTELFGTSWETPIFLCPAGSQRAFHAEGELGTARAASAKKTLQILSNQTSTGVEEVAQALGAPPWYQLYATTKWEVTEKVVQRAEAAGCPVLVWTVDNLPGRNTETERRIRKLDNRQCSSCHQQTPAGLRAKVMYKGLDVTGVSITTPALTWDFVDRLKQATRMKLVLKGIETREDAQLCCEHGVDGIVVSNHGGRAAETGRGTIECLPEVIDGVRGRVPVLVDGGFRRGTDIFKALALGARAVGVGRPYLWGLGAFGQAGVERVLDILRAELTLIMKQCGTRSIAEIGRASIV